MSLVVHWHQRDVTATTLAPGALTPTDRQLLAALLDARELGLQALVFPIVWVEKREVGKWRGTLTPRDRDAWWQSYEEFILHYARLASAGDAAWLSVGSELGSTETWRDRWYHLISRVEETTPSALLYSANWDHFEQVSFWPRLAAVGINGYVPLTRDRDADVAALKRGWKRAKKDLLARTEKLDKPLVLTEVGYLSRDGAAVKPWDHGSKAKLDLEEQRRAYAAFTAVWGDERRLAGVFFWDWTDAGGELDRGYTPRGKPAEAVVRGFFSTRRAE